MNDYDWVDVGHWFLSSGLTEMRSSGSGTITLEGDYR